MRSATLGPPFQIGETVYVPWANAYAQREIPCPVCAGQLSVVLILGSGEHVPVQCEACALGFEGPRGVVTIREPTSGICEQEITGIERRGDSWLFKLGYESLPASAIFRDRMDAETRCLAMRKEAEAQAQGAFETRFRTARGKQTWTVRYHRQQIAVLERQLSWHRAKLSAATAAPVDNA